MLTVVIFKSSLIRSTTFFALFYLLMCACAFGAAPKGLTNLTTGDLIKKAAQFDIEIIDWRDLQKPEKITVDLKSLRSQKTWLEFLEKQFVGSWAVESYGTVKKMVLLPKGIEAQFIQKAKKYAQQADGQRFLPQTHNTTQLKDIDILKLPEVITLKELAESETKRTISYQRLVNPEDISSAYSFKVKYIDSLQMFAPFEKNGMPVKNQMEGFSSYSTFYNFLMKHSEQCKVSRSGNTVFFQIDNNDNESNIALEGMGSHFKITSTLRRNEVPLMETQLEGRQTEFKSITTIYAKEGTVTLVDAAIIH